MLYLSESGLLNTPSRLLSPWRSAVLHHRHFHISMLWIIYKWWEFSIIFIIIRSVPVAFWDECPAFYNGNLVALVTGCKKITWSLCRGCCGRNRAGRSPTRGAGQGLVGVAVRGAAVGRHPGVGGAGRVTPRTPRPGRGPTRSRARRSCHWDPDSNSLCASVHRVPQEGRRPREPAWLLISSSWHKQHEYCKWYKDNHFLFELTLGSLPYRLFHDITC